MPEPRDFAHALFSLLLAVYGLRRSEVARLQLSDFDWRSETFLVRNRYPDVSLQPKAHRECAWGSQTNEGTPLRLIEQPSLLRTANREFSQQYRQPFLDCLLRQFRNGLERPAAVGSGRRRAVVYARDHVLQLFER